jgi:hypothetical protein
MARITQGRVVSNGPQLVVAAQLDAGGTYQCIVGAGPEAFPCALTPMMNAQMNSTRTLLWTPGAPTNPCETLQVFEPAAGDLFFGSPRIALGAAPDAGATEVMLTARAGGSVQSHQHVKLTLSQAGEFTEVQRLNVGEPMGLLLPALLRDLSASQAGVLGGVVGTTPPTMPPTPAVSVRFTNNLGPISLNAGGPLVTAPASKTETHIVAMDADNAQFLVVAQVDQAGAVAFGDPGADCAGPGLCGLWRTLDGMLMGGGFTLTSPGVYPSAGILIGPQEARNVVWAGQFEEGFSLAKPVNGPHTFIARQKL